MSDPTATKTTVNDAINALSHFAGEAEVEGAHLLQVVTSAGKHFLNDAITAVNSKIHPVTGAPTITEAPK